MFRARWSCESRWPFCPSASSRRRCWRTSISIRWSGPLTPLASVWLGLVSFFFLAACASWIVYGVPLLFGVHVEKHALAAVCFGLGLLAGICAIVNAAWTRVVRVTVKLPNLPAAWRGRTAAVVSDLHLGHVRNTGFLRRIVRKLSQLHPDVLFIPGDLYDGTTVDLPRLAKPWAEFSAPLGAYFITGNHEQFSSPSKYLDAVRQSGIRVLENEKIVLDGLQIVGVHYRDSTQCGEVSIDPAASGPGPECGQHPARSQSQPLAGRGRSGHFLATLRSYASRAVFPVHGNRFPHVWEICLWIESLRRSCGLHFLRRRHLGPAHAAGIKSRNCPDPIRVKLYRRARRAARWKLRAGI